MRPVLIYLLACLISLSGGQEKCAERPGELVDAENGCQSAPEAQDGFFERMHHRARGFLDRIKQDLGIKTENKEQPKKCEYYKCIFEKLMMLNQMGLPDLSLIQDWVSKHVSDASARTITNDHASTCFRMLATSAINIQSNCETAVHLMMCLNSVDECDTFKFP